MGIISPRTRLAEGVAVDANDEFLETGFSHPDIAEPIVLTRHAWKRFRERFYGAHPEFAHELKCREMMVERLQQLIFASRPARLSAEERTLKLINHRFIQAGWFDNKEFNLRFVIKKDVPRYLLTIEEPHRFHIEAWSKFANKKKKHLSKNADSKR